MEMWFEAVLVLYFLFLFLSSCGPSNLSSFPPPPITAWEMIKVQPISNRLSIMILTVILTVILIVIITVILIVIVILIPFGGGENCLIVLWTVKLDVGCSDTGRRDTGMWDIGISERDKSQVYYWRCRFGEVGKKLWFLLYYFRAWGLGFGIWDLGFGVWGLGFGAWDIYGIFINGISSYPLFLFLFLSF